MQRAAFIRSRVDLLLLRGQLAELVALGVAPDAPGLVGEVDLEAVPAQLPHDRDGDDARAVGARAHRHAGGAERAGDAADRARVVGRVEDLQRALHLQVGVGGHRAHVAGALAPRLGGAAGHRLLLVRRRLGGRGHLVLDLAGALAARPQAIQERAPTAVVTGVAKLQLVVPGLPDPPLVLRARRAEVTDLTSRAA